MAALAELERPLAAACRAARDYLEQVRQVDVQRLVAVLLSAEGRVTAQRRTVAGGG